MSNWERHGMEVPMTVKHSFACAVHDFARGSGLTVEGKKVLETQYFTEAFYFEAIEAIYEYNDWALTTENRKNFRKLFRARTSTGA